MSPSLPQEIIGIIISYADLPTLGAIRCASSTLLWAARGPLLARIGALLADKEAPMKARIRAIYGAIIHGYRNPKGVVMSVHNANITAFFAPHWGQWRAYFYLRFVLNCEDKWDLLIHELKAMEICKNAQLNCILEIAKVMSDVSLITGYMGPMIKLYEELRREIYSIYMPPVILSRVACTVLLNWATSAPQLIEGNTQYFRIYDPDGNIEYTNSMSYAIDIICKMRVIGGHDEVYDRAFLLARNKYKKGATEGLDREQILYMMELGIKANYDPSMFPTERRWAIDWAQ